jgi:hypothetical protein
VEFLLAWDLTCEFLLTSGRSVGIAVNTLSQERDSLDRGSRSLRGRAAVNEPHDQLVAGHLYRWNLRIHDTPGSIVFLPVIIARFLQNFTARHKAIIYHSESLTLSLVQSFKNAVKFPFNRYCSAKILLDNIL